MAFTDSTFLVEILVEELLSYIHCKEFYIQSKFSNIFLLNLKDPNLNDPLKRSTSKKSRIKRENAGKLSIEEKVQVGQSILFVSQVDRLITTMKTFPIELSLFDKDDPDTKLGSTHVPWSPVYIDYLYKLNSKYKDNSVHTSSVYNIYDDLTCKRMATIRLNIKFTHLYDKLTTSREEICKYNYIQSDLIKPKPITVLNTIKEVPSNITKDTCSVELTNSTRKLKANTSNKANPYRRRSKSSIPIDNKIAPLVDKGPGCNKTYDIISENTNNQSLTDLDKHKQIEIIETKSCSFMNGKYFNILNYIYGTSETKPLQNQVLCVGYCTVENDSNKDKSSSKSSMNRKQSSREPFTKSKSDSNVTDKFKICVKDCPSKNYESSCDEDLCTLDLPTYGSEITVTKCKQVNCESKHYREVVSPVDDVIKLDLANLDNKCCDVRETIEKVVGEMKAEIKFDNNDCYCSCECTFGFVNRTTYCEICGGYTKPGEDTSQNFYKTPFPCPIYHNKMVDKKGSDSDKSTKKGSKSPTSGKSLISGAETEKGKGKNKRKDERFKFKYGFVGIPAKIGHSDCVMPCTGSLNPVPKNMGWLWNSDDVPGIKCRPLYKPGAINKHVLHLLRIAQNPDTVLKKRRRETGKPKRPLKRPLLTVAKKDGEYTVNMETMKVYSKPRALNQHPYEDKPVLTYTIGRTEEENRDRQKKKEREKRRLERDQRTFIQSTFTDMCKEICLKTYQQALGILPDAEDPDCTCYPKYPGPDDTNLERSCSCSENSTSIGSDTDSDEWVIEFTPPNALFDPKYKGKKVIKTDNSSQYNYLDYRVKVLDRNGNQVPRFFKGPDGSTQCSDLGGFWSPDHKWLVINSDGFIGPDERWAPLLFIGPNGEQVDCENGKFQIADGTWLTVGVDGYVDGNGKWKYYKKSKNPTVPKKKCRTESPTKDAGDKKENVASYAASDVTWSCLGDANPKHLSKLGIIGHGQDKKLLLQALKSMLAHGEQVTIPQSNVVPRLNTSKKRKLPFAELDRQQCKHSLPSDKGVKVDEHGRKTYFKAGLYTNRRPQERVNQLTHQGISLSSFHEPCFHSFINQDTVKRQQYKTFLKNKTCEHDENTKCRTAQYKFRYGIS